MPREKGGQDQSLASASHGAGKGLLADQDKEGLLDLEPRTILTVPPPHRDSPPKKKNHASLSLHLPLSKEPRASQAGTAEGRG